MYKVLYISNNVYRVYNYYVCMCKISPTYIIKFIFFSYCSTLIFSELWPSLSIGNNTNTSNHDNNIVGMSF